MYLSTHTNHYSKIITTLESVFSTSKRKLLLEIAWEVCNQVGGIYTVIRTKVPAMVEKWDDNYVALGPYFPQRAAAEFEPITDLDETESGRPFVRCGSWAMGSSMATGWLRAGPAWCCSTSTASIRTN